MAKAGDTGNYFFKLDWFKDAKVIQLIFSYLPTRPPSL